MQQTISRERHDRIVGDLERERDEARRERNELRSKFAAAEEQRVVVTRELCRTHTQLVDAREQLHAIRCILEGSQPDLGTLTVERERVFVQMSALALRPFG